jgi:hypothetical protein
VRLTSILLLRVCTRRTGTAVFDVQSRFHHAPVGCRAHGVGRSRSVLQAVRSTATGPYPTAAVRTLYTACHELGPTMAISGARAALCEKQRACGRELAGRRMLTVYRRCCASAGALALCDLGLKLLDHPSQFGAWARCIFRQKISDSLFNRTLLIHAQIIHGLIDPNGQHILRSAGKAATTRFRPPQRSQ